MAVRVLAAPWVLYQLWLFVKQIVTFDWGKSWATNEAVSNLFATRLPATLTVMLPILVLDALLAQMTLDAVGMLVDVLEEGPDLVGHGHQLLGLHGASPAGLRSMASRSRCHRGCAAAGAQR